MSKLDTVVLFGWLFEIWTQMAQINHKPDHIVQMVENLSSTLVWYSDKFGFWAYFYIKGLLSIKYFLAEVKFAFCGFTLNTRWRDCLKMIRKRKNGSSKKWKIRSKKFLKKIETTFFFTAHTLKLFTGSIHIRYTIMGIWIVWRSIG